MDDVDRVLVAQTVRGRTQLAVTEQQVYARSALTELSYLERLRIAEEARLDAENAKSAEDAG